MDHATHTDLHKYNAMAQIKIKPMAQIDMSTIAEIKHANLVTNTDDKNYINANFI